MFVKTAGTSELFASTRVPTEIHEISTVLVPLFCSLISKPFLFDNRLLTKTYEGLDIKSKIEGGLPEEFKIDREALTKDYLWAPNKFEKYVDRCSEDIKKQFGNPNMSRTEMLDALAFGSFEDHKQKTLNLIKEGKIPAININ